MAQDELLIYLFARAQRQVRNHLHNAFAQNNIAITPVQARILFVLQKQSPLTMTQLSGILSTDNAAITRLVDKLVKSGHVTRKTSPTDRRTYLVEPSPSGLQEIEKTEAVIAQVNNEVAGALTGAQQEQFAGFLSRILDSLLPEEERTSPKALKLDFYIEGLEDLVVPHALW